MRLRPIAFLTLVVCLTLFAIALLSACGSATPLQAQIETKVSVDEATNHATIQIKSTGGWIDVALFVTDPEGKRQPLLAGNVSAAGATIDTGELSPGDYTYVVYAKRQEPGDSATLPDSAINPENLAASGTFTIP
jgi:hypothetical protein